MRQKRETRRITGQRVTQGKTIEYSSAQLK